MTTTTAVAIVDPEFSDVERYALTAFLAGYRGLTREAYALDLRQFIAWCEEHDLRLFAVRRADIECFARDLEAHGRARATVARRLCTVSGFYRYAEPEGLLRPALTPAPAATRAPTQAPPPPTCTSTPTTSLTRPHSFRDADLATMATPGGRPESAVRVIGCCAMWRARTVGESITLVDPWQFGVGREDACCRGGNSPSENRR